MKRHEVNFSDNTIQALFGFEDAESEQIDRLKEYYFKNESYDSVISDMPIKVLVGHKGTGKSALFKVAMSEELYNGRIPIFIRPDDIAELGKGDDAFLLRIRQWKHGLTRIIGSKVLQEIGIYDEAPISKLSQFGLKLLPFLLKHAISVSQQDRAFPGEELDTFINNKKVIVYLDDLDRGWEGKREDILRISALLNSVRDLANENIGLSFRISLRTDVYYLVRTSDESTDKIESSIVWHSWKNHEIYVMLIKRILSFFGERANEEILLKTSQAHLGSFLDSVFEKKFLGEGKWSNAPMGRVLMSLIRKRPRDLVKLCYLAAREASKSKSQLIGTQHIKAILPEYSIGRLQDTINEYRTELPTIERLLLGMKPTTKEKGNGEIGVFTSTQLQTKLNNILEQGRFVFANGKIASAKDLEFFLFKINFLTARKKIDDENIDRKYFEEARYLSSYYANFGYDWEIHPAYRWALQPDSIQDLFYKISLSAL
jgi:hypothetical protein